MTLKWFDILLNCFTLLYVLNRDSNAIKKTVGLHPVYKTTTLFVKCAESREPTKLPIPTTCNSSHLCQVTCFYTFLLRPVTSEKRPLCANKKEAVTDFKNRDLTTSDFKFLFVVVNLKSAKIRMCQLQGRFSEHSWRRQRLKNEQNTMS